MGCFDSVESIYCFDTEKVKDLPEGIDLNNWDAVYSKDLDGIIFFPEISTYSGDQQFHVATHELCHALLDSEGDQRHGTFIVEGEVELLALIFSTSLGLHPEPTYPNGVLAAAWLNDLFGEKQVRDAIIANELEEKIDESLEEGAYAKINIGGYMAEYDIDPKTGRNAEIELLCHLSKELGKTDIGKKHLKTISDSFEGVNIKYFEKILSS